MKSSEVARCKQGTIRQRIANVEQLVHSCKTEMLDDALPCIASYESHVMTLGSPDSCRDVACTMRAQTFCMAEGGQCQAHDCLQMNVPCLILLVTEAGVATNFGDKLVWHEAFHQVWGSVNERGSSWNAVTAL